MGCFQSAPPKEFDADGASSDNVDIELLEEQVNELFKFKVLLLGAGESGKSTIVKQLKLIHKKKVTPEEKDLVAISLHQNLIDCVRALLNATEKFGYELTEEEEKMKDEVFSHDESQRVPPELGTSCLKLFNSENVQKAYGRRGEYWLLDSFKYYIDNVDRFCESDYVPTEEDCVMARIRTTGIVVTDLEQRIKQDAKEAPDTLSFQVVDVGGQRNERKKWMHCFDDVKCILFCVNLAGYNQVLFEDSSKNRILESLELFEQVTGNPLFKDTPIFVFLNKKDLFEGMVQEVDMKNVFEDYTGGQVMQPALQFIQDEFTKRLPEGKKVNENVYYNVVSARWRRDIRCAFEDVKKKLYEDNKDTILKQVANFRKEQRSIRASLQKGQGGGGCGGCMPKICCCCAPQPAPSQSE